MQLATFLNGGKAASGGSQKTCPVISMLMLSEERRTVMMRKIPSVLLSRLKLCLLFIVFLQVSCREKTRSGNSHPVKSGSEKITYAHRFGLDDYPGFKVLHIFSSRAGQRDSASYLLVSDTSKAPSGFPHAQIIRVPLKSLVVMSSTHIAQAAFAGKSDLITGLGSLQYVSDPVVRKNIGSGKVKEVGLDATLNKELLISMRPSLVMVMGTPGGSMSPYRTLTAGGIPVLQNMEWLESSPLGRAEWVKVMAALTGTSDEVGRKFNDMARSYLQLASAGRKAEKRPRVITGMPYKGVWNVPAGNSYVAQLLRDAGAAYKWEKTPGEGSLALNFEAVAPEAMQADVWINTGNAGTKKEIGENDIRYTDFKPYRAGYIYNNINRINDIGANDYWESGSVNPQLILADLISLLHPQLLPGHRLVYYKQLR